MRIGDVASFLSSLRLGRRSSPADELERLAQAADRLARLAGSHSGLDLHGEGVVVICVGASVGDVRRLLVAIGAAGPPDGVETA
jgi:hypothetical protein